MLNQEFSVDEGGWIATSRYFWTVFIDRDLIGPTWEPSYEVLTHPPVARYVVGFGLWLQGWAPERLNGLYQNRRDRAFNEAAGNVPSPELLTAARWVEFVIALGVLLLMYATGRTLRDPLAGTLAVALALSNPLLRTLWTRTLAEAPLAFFSLLALVLALRSLPRLTMERVSRRSCVAAGIALGLAGATKVSGLLGCVGLAYFFGVQQAFAVWRTGRLVKLGSWLALGLAVAVTFIASNPMLYPNPIGNTTLLLAFRAQEMDDQREFWPSNAVPRSLAVRSALIATSVFKDFGSLGRLGLEPIEVGLFVVGVGVLLGGVAHDLKTVGIVGPAALFLCWVAAVYAGSTINLGFDSSHYYAPLVLLNVLIDALALSWAGRWLLDRIRRARTRTCASQCSRG